MTLALDWSNAIGLLGALLTFASFVSKRMVPLRSYALGGNACFIAYSALRWDPASLALNCLLLPVNLKRTWDIKKLTAEIRQATEASPVSQWLLPHMTRRSFKAGEVLFRKGDAADAIVYISSGQVKVEDRDELLGAGELIGEIGVFSPEKHRTKTVTCRTDGVLYRMTDEMIYQLYYQHPAIGFHFMRLVVQRLMRDLNRHMPAA
jgi:hypothetical protein